MGFMVCGGTAPRGRDPAPVQGDAGLYVGLSGPLPEWPGGGDGLSHAKDGQCPAESLSWAVLAASHS